MATILRLTSRAKSRNASSLKAKAQIAKAEAAAKQDAAEKASKKAPVATSKKEPKATQSFEREGKTLSPKLCLLWDRMLQGPISRLEASVLLYGVNNRIGEAGAQIYTLARPVTGVSSVGTVKFSNYFLTVDRAGKTLRYTLKKREEPKAAKKQAAKRKTARAK